jgi:4-hydroxybenzoate polyprenyltransferase
MAIAISGWAMDASTLGLVVLAFLVSACVSSVNYAVNEVLDAPFDATHPVKCRRPIPSGRVEIAPLLGITAFLALATVAVTAWGFPRQVLESIVALFAAGLLYNLPPVRLKDWPYLDAATEALTNPIRLAIGWLAVSGAILPPFLLLVAVWAFGAFVMTGKRVAELRQYGPAAVRYRSTFARYTVRGLLTVQVIYAALGVATVSALFAAQRPALLASLPLIVVLVAWVLRMTFEPDSPVVEPERLYRRPVFLLVSALIFATVLVLAAR